jgi:hypothetical protein
MRLSCLHLLPLAMLTLAACHDNGVSVNPRPPLGGVRLINAVPDGGPVDVRMIDQIEWSVSSVVDNTTYGLPFRSGTIYWPTEAKARHIRVFPTDSSLAVTTTVLLDTTITIEANKNVTLMLVGSRATGGKVSFIKFDDSPPTMTGTQMAVRMVNASGPGQVPASADGYIVKDTTATGLPATATYAGVASLVAAPYVVRDTGLFALRATATGNTTTFWATTAPAGAPAAGLIGATAGYRGLGSAISGFLFPRSTAGTGAPQAAAFTAPKVVFFVDFIPAPPQ